MAVDVRIAQSLDLAAARKWDEARHAVEGVEDPIAAQLLTLFEELRRCDAEQKRSHAAVRHELGNLLTIAQANVEGMIDGMVEPTAQRLDNVRKALAAAALLVSEPARVRARNRHDKRSDLPATNELGTSTVEEFILVQCPYSSARRHLEIDMLSEVGRPGSLRLRVPLAGAHVSKNVVVMITPSDDPMHMDQPWHVRWTPEGGGPYPDFDGELTVRADEDWNTAQLELRGVYIPPGGALGRAFDRVVGRHIASATAQSLLRSVADTLEARYHEQEAGKQGGSLDER